MGDVLGLWDGNPIKLDCNDHCTTTNVINSLSNKKRKKYHLKFQWTECSNQKTQSGRLHKKARAYNMLSTRDSP